MHFLSLYALFLAKTITFVVAFLIIALGIVVIFSRDKKTAKEYFEVKKINDKYDQMAQTLRAKILSKALLKKYKKQTKKTTGNKEKNLFVVNFKGDIKASAVESLRNEVTAILTIAKPEDQVLVILESGGGMVHTYGLAASQLERIKQKNIPLLICVDKIAASGGYLMACVANKILAAPFAIIGSIGVLAQLPNFHRLLKKHNIDFEQLSAGEYKRTLTIFGENTDKARLKLKDELEHIQQIFKDFITQNRPQVDIDKVATGEHWLASKAFELNLVDKLITSDDFLLSQRDTTNLYEVQYRTKKSLGEKFFSPFQAAFSKIYELLVEVR
jgi:serine protease SohB